MAQILGVEMRNVKYQDGQIEGELYIDNMAAGCISERNGKTHVVVTRPNLERILELRAKMFFSKYPSVSEPTTENLGSHLAQLTKAECAFNDLEKASAKYMRNKDVCPHLIQHHGKLVGLLSKLKAEEFVAKVRGDAKVYTCKEQFQLW